jgi:polysaccharide export outer membrane protein
MKVSPRLSLVLSMAVCLAPAVSAQQQAPAVAPSSASAPATAPAGATLPPGYVIGPDDVLTVVFWREKDMSAEVTVRPDGKISLPLLNDIDAAGITPEQLRLNLEKAAGKLMSEPNASVSVKTINSRKVYITGNVMKPGTFPLTGEMTVLQLIALAGGLQEWADSKNVVILRKQDGRDQRFTFNYKDVTKQKHPEQNIALKPGDTVIVP